MRRSEVISNENLFGSLRNDSVVIIVQVVLIRLWPIDFKLLNRFSNGCIFFAR